MQDWYNDIEKYKGGQLSAAEMHALEKRALSDPFLAEAIEGIDLISHEDFVTDVNELNNKIRAGKKGGFFTPLRIAASVILLMGVAFTAYLLTPAKPPEFLINSATISDSVVSPADSTIKRPELLTLADTKDSMATKANTNDNKEKKEIKARAVMPVPPSESIRKTDVTSPIIDASENLIAESTAADEILTKDKQPIAEVKSQTDSVTTLSKAQANKAMQSNLVTATPARIVTGRVTSGEDNGPLPGVNVIIKGTTRGTITDEQGNYSIELGPEKNPELVFSSIGTFTKEIAVNNQSNIDTQMKDDVSQLSEVVVVGYGTDNGLVADGDLPTVIIAEPNGGRRAFKKYLEANLQYPQLALENKVEGKVTVQFTVTTEGVLNDFRVIKGIGSGCDDEVIRLIKEGPKWYPSRKGDTAIDSRMRVRMRFKLP